MEEPSPSVFEDRLTKVGMVIVVAAIFFGAPVCLAVVAVFGNMGWPFPVRLALVGLMLVSFCAGTLMLYPHKRTKRGRRP
ncbi:MAG: hypothetical protein WC787_00575 [Patescibacteria group bacterium]|jgi:hypothetical protein